MRFDPGQNQWQPLKSGLALEVTDRAAAEEASSALSRIAGACRSSQPVDPLQQTRERLTQLLTFDTPQASNSASFRQSCLLEYRFTQPGGGYSIATLVPLGSIPSNLYLLRMPPGANPLTDAPGPVVDPGLPRAVVITPPDGTLTQLDSRQAGQSRPLKGGFGLLVKDRASADEALSLVSTLANACR